MKVSAAGRKAIAGHEGVRLKAYPDPATGGDPWTIGVGHTSDAGPPKVIKGMTITATQCDEILSRDLATFEEAVEDSVGVPLNQNQFDALVSLAFNIGAGAFGRSTLVKKLNAGDYKGAADQFSVWNKAAGKVMKGLVTRRAAEKALFLKAMPAPSAPVPILKGGAQSAVGIPTSEQNQPVEAVTEPGFWSRFWAALLKRIKA